MVQTDGISSAGVVTKESAKIPVLESFMVSEELPQCTYACVWQRAARLGWYRTGTVARWPALIGALAALH